MTCDLCDDTRSYWPLAADSAAVTLLCIAQRAEFGYCAMHKRAEIGSKRKTELTAQAAVAPVSSLTKAVPSGDAVSYFHRTWPPTALAVVFIINGVWIGLLGYGLFTMGEKVF